MSHFVVLVTNTDVDNLESQMEPFYEQGDEDDYYMKKEYFVKRNKKSITEYVENEIKWFDEALARDDLSEEQKEWPVKNRKLLLNILKIDDVNKQIDEIREYCGGLENKVGLYWLCNPNAKWDWWVIGGRWDNWLVKKDGKKCNECLASEVDFDGMRKAEMKHRAEYYDDEVAIAKKNGRAPMFWGYEKVPTKEEYVNGAEIAPYAVLHEGEWIEKGQMGWWGMSDDKYSGKEWEEKFREFIEGLPPDTQLTVVDCHI